MKKLIALSALTVLSAAAFAENKTETGVNYNELSVNYISQRLTGSSSTNTFLGYGINGSALVSESVFIYGSYGSTAHTFSNGKVTLGQTQAGIGYRFPLSDATDLNLAGSYSSATVTGSNNITGNLVGVGVRSRALSPDVETNIGAIYSTSKDADVTTNGSGFVAGLKFKITGNWLVGVDYMSIKNVAQYKIGVGYRF